MHKTSLCLTITLLMTLPSIASEKDDLKEKPNNIQKNQVSPAIEGLDKRIEKLQNQRKIINEINYSNTTSELEAQLNKRKQAMGEEIEIKSIPHFGPTFVAEHQEELTIESINEKIEMLESLGLDDDWEVKRQLSSLKAQRNKLQGNSNSSLDQIVEERISPSSLGPRFVAEHQEELTIESINEKIEMLESLGLDDDWEVKRQLSSLKAQRNKLQGNSNSSLNN